MSMDDAQELTRHVEGQVAAYEQLHPTYKLFAEILGRVLAQITRELGLNAIVQVRAKEKTSFAEKAVRKRSTYPDAINQMTDLCGGRIITECKDDIEPVSRRLREYFEIVEAEDVLDRLGTGEFGYRSMHFIVALKREALPESLLTEAAGKRIEGGSADTANAIRILFERRPLPGAAKGDSTTLPRFRAEIQLRTLLQHAWSAIGHDRIYKSEFAVPEKWRRDANRVAAYLEEADESFSRIVNGVESYRGDLGAYMTPEQRRQEMRRLSAVAAFDPHNLGLAQRIARLALSLQDWSGARQALAPFVQRWEAEKRGHAEDAQATSNGTHLTPSRELRSRASALLTFGTAQWSESRSAGREYLEWACRLDPASVDAFVALGRTYIESGEHTQALGCFESTFRLAPNEPHVLVNLVCCKLIAGASTDILSLIVPNMEAAAARCRDRIEIKLGLPGSYFDRGMLLMLLNRPLESLRNYIKAASVCGPDELARQFEHIDLLHSKCGERFPELDWVRRLLALASSLLAKSEPTEGTGGKHVNVSGSPSKSALLSRFRSEGFPSFERPVVMVAGSTSRADEVNVRRYQNLLNAAFDGFSGTIVSGGTTAGIAGMVGDLPVSNGGAIRKLACLPRRLNDGIVVHDSYSTYPSTSQTFSPLEPIQVWIDLISEGVDPARIKLLGIGGGEIAAIEYRMALMLGASVGIVTGSGGSASEILADPDWGSTPTLFALPPDPRILNMFIRGIPQATTLRDDDREALAREAHDSYRSKQMSRLSGTDPSMADWSGLPEDLRRSNRSQIDCIEAHLDLVGLSLVTDATGSAEAFSLDASHIERMAENEHARWCLERLGSGWHLGERDPDARTTPFLVSWHELPESIREIDRQAVSALPTLTKRFGYRIVLTGRK